MLLLQRYEFAEHVHRQLCRRDEDQFMQPSARPISAQTISFACPRSPGVGGTYGYGGSNKYECRGLEDTTTSFCQTGCYVGIGIGGLVFLVCLACILHVTCGVKIPLFFFIEAKPRWRRGGRVHNSGSITAVHTAGGF